MPPPGTAGASTRTPEFPYRDLPRVMSPRTAHSSTPRHSEVRTVQSAFYCQRWDNSEIIVLNRPRWRGSATGRALDLRSVGRGFKSYSRQRCVTTLSKLFTLCASVTNLVPARGRWCSAAGEVTAGLAESNGSLPPGEWLTVTCGLTACTPGSALGATLGIEYGKAFTFTFLIDQEREQMCLIPYQLCDDKTRLRSFIACRCSWNTVE